MNIVYLRSSTTIQNPKIQLDGILNEFDLKEFEIYTENQSAYKEVVKRKEFEKIKRQIILGKVDNLFVWDLDRIYRNRNRLKEFFQLCRINGTKIHSYNQSWLNSMNQIPAPFNEIMYELMVDIFGWIGQQESELKSKRIKNAIVKKDGHKTKSYLGNNWGRKGISVQAKKKLLKMRQDGMSIREIAEEFVYFDKNRNPKKLSKSGVHKLLSEIDQ